MKYHLRLSSRINEAGIRIGIEWIRLFVFRYFEKTDKMFEGMGWSNVPGNEDNVTSYNCYPLAFVASNDLKPHTFIGAYDKPGELKRRFIKKWILEDEFQRETKDESTGLTVKCNEDFAISDHPTMREILRSCFYSLVDYSSQNCFYRLCFEQHPSRGVFHNSVKEAEEYLYRIAEQKKKPVASIQAKEQGGNKVKKPIKKELAENEARRVGYLVKGYDVLQQVFINSKIQREGLTRLFTENRRGPKKRNDIPKISQSSARTPEEYEKAPKGYELRNDWIPDNISEKTVFRVLNLPLNKALYLIDHLSENRSK
jgi:hypothetical protein